MPALLQIRNVPDDVRRVMKARAAARGQSLNTYLLEILGREAVRPSVAEVLERAAKRAGGSTVSSLDVVDDMRRGREGQSDRAPS